MNYQLDIKIQGNPIAKKRPRFFRRGNYTGAYNSQETEEGRFLLEAMAQLEKAKHLLPIPKGTPITMWCWFAMPMPQSVQKAFNKGKVIQHTKKPDLDNLIKFVKDCLNGQVWHDDSQVIRVDATKFYAGAPDTEIRIRWEG